MQLKKLAFLEGVFNDRADDGESGFDTDVALSTGELNKLIPELIEALGGEIVPGMAMPDAPAAAPTKPKQEAVTAVGEDDDPPF